MTRNPPAFTLKEWEEIVRAMILSNETRKREYVKWSAAGISSAFVLINVFLQVLPTADFGPLWWPSFFYLWVLVYFGGLLLWELMKPAVVTAVIVLISGRVIPEKPKSKFEEFLSIAEVRASQVLVSMLTVGICITLAIVWLAWVYPVVSVLLLSVFALRLAFLVFVAIQWKRLRVASRTIRPQRDEILNKLPVDYPPVVLEAFRKRDRVQRLLSLGSYALQLGLLLLALPFILPLTIDMLQLGIIGLGFAALTWGVSTSWSIASYFSEGVRQLRDLHGQILTGKIVNPDQVSAEMARIVRPEGD